MAVDVEHKRIILSVTDGLFRINDTKLHYCSVYHQTCLWLIHKKLN